MWAYDKAVCIVSRSDRTLAASLECLASCASISDALAAAAVSALACSTPCVASRK